jgi:hypothetical protein
MEREREEQAPVIHCGGLKAWAFAERVIEYGLRVKGVEVIKEQEFIDAEVAGNA